MSLISNFFPRGFRSCSHVCVWHDVIGLDLFWCGSSITAVTRYTSRRGIKLLIGSSSFPVMSVKHNMKHRRKVLKWIRSQCDKTDCGGSESLMLREKCSEVTHYLDDSPEPSSLLLVLCKHVALEFTWPNSVSVSSSRSSCWLVFLHTYTVSE